MQHIYISRVISILLGAITLVANQAGAVNPDELIRPAEAFKYEVTDEGNALRVDWNIEPGYYLYKKKLSFELSGNDIVAGDYELPTGLAHSDEFFGEQQVYRDTFTVRLPYTVGSSRPGSIELVTKSQGCADIGICFPPQSWSTQVKLKSDSLAKTGNALTSLFGAAQPELLPVDEAFEPLVIVIDSNTLEVSWRVAPGHYLYKDKTSISITSDLVRAGQPQFPTGEMKFDEFFGESEVYRDDVFVRVPLARASPESITLEIELAYQGCADIGICYPPTTRTLTAVMPVATADNSVSAPVTEQGRLVKLISEGNLLLVLATFFGAGLLLAFTPCVLPMVPILSGIIAGEGDKISTSRGFTLSLSYVMGMAMVYTAAGIGFAAAGQQAQAVFQQPWILITFAGLFVVLALGMFGLYDLQMPASIQARLAAVSGKQKSGTMIGAFVMGALSSLIVTACVAPPLVATLTVIGQTGDMLRGGGALFALSMGMGTPLLIVGASAGKLLPKAGPWMSAIKNAFGVMMLGLAIWMLSRLLPGAVTLGLWAVLAFMSGIYLGAMNRLEAGSGNAEKMGKGLGLLAMLYGAILLAGAFLGGHDPLRPLSNLNLAGQQNTTIQHGLNFNRIKSVDDLDQALTRAAANGKTTILDFYADWCVSCKEMEAYTFTEEGVQSALANTVLLQADVTANDAIDQALLQRFGVFGPPTIVFFDRNGQQRKGYEVVGYMKAAQFIDHLELTLQTTASTSDQK